MLLSGKLASTGLDKPECCLATQFNFNMQESDDVFRMEYDGKMVTVEELAAIRRKKFAGFAQKHKVTEQEATPELPPTTPPFQIELVWNREFDFVQYADPFYDLDAAIACAESDGLHGDGGRIKKHRIVDAKGSVVYQYGKKVGATPKTQ